MYVFQLFAVDDPVTLLDARLVQSGEVTIGRDAAAGWPIVDPDCELSRIHCTVETQPGQICVTPHGANGVFVGDGDHRLPDGEATGLPVPGAFRMGRYRIAVSMAPQEDEPATPEDTVVLAVPAPVEIAEDWIDEAPRQEAAPLGESLLEAFCRGAGIDPSQLSSEDPAEIMQRAGAIYRQTVLGLAALMKQRDGARASYRLAQTAIAGTDNNPFKWAPTQRLAIDLLSPPPAGFLPGEKAITASFRAVDSHMIATFAAMRGAVQTTLDQFDPSAVHEAARLRSTIFQSKSAAVAAELEERHALFSDELNGGNAGALEQAFARAYLVAEQQVSRSPVVAR